MAALSASLSTDSRLRSSATTRSSSGAASAFSSSARSAAWCGRSRAGSLGSDAADATACCRCSDASARSAPLVRTLATARRDSSSAHKIATDAHDEKRRSRSASAPHFGGRSPSAQRLRAFAVSASKASEPSQGGGSSACKPWRFTSSTARRNAKALSVVRVAPKRLIPLSVRRCRSAAEWRNAERPSLSACETSPRKNSPHSPAGQGRSPARCAQVRATSRAQMAAASSSAASHARWPAEGATRATNTFARRGAAAPAAARAQRWAATAPGSRASATGQPAKASRRAAGARRSAKSRRKKPPAASTFSHSPTTTRFTRATSRVLDNASAQSAQDDAATTPR